MRNFKKRKKKERKKKSTMSHEKGKITISHGSQIKIKQRWSFKAVDTKIVESAEV